MTVSPHALDAAVALTPAGEHRFTGQTHPTYANMVGPFGGTIAATLLNGALSHPERLGEPLSLTVHTPPPSPMVPSRCTPARCARIARPSTGWSSCDSTTPSRLLPP